MNSNYNDTNQIMVNDKLEREDGYNYTFGILTALAIIFVVAGHLDYNIFTLDGLFPYYSFHMPLFIFISGYFYKEEYEKHVRVFCIKKIKRLVIPYFLWNLFYGILVMALKPFGFTIGDDLNLYTLFLQPFIDGHQFYFNLAAWFLLALFIVEVIYLLANKLIHVIFHNEMLGLLILFIISFIMGVIGILLANRGYNYSFWLILVRTLFFVPFYCIGYIYKRILEKRDIVNNYAYFFVLFGGVFLVIMDYGWIPTCSAVFGKFFENPIMQYFVAFMGIAFWLRIAKIITPIVRKDGWLIYLAKNSFSVMMHHIGIFYVLMLLLVLISKISALFQDIDISVIKTNAGNWYCPNGNNNFLLFYLIMTLVICVVLCKIKDKIKMNWFHKSKKENSYGK